MEHDVTFREALKVWTRVGLLRAETGGPCHRGHGGLSYRRQGPENTVSNGSGRSCLHRHVFLSSAFSLGHCCFWTPRLFGDEFLSEVFRRGLPPMDLRQFNRG